MIIPNIWKNKIHVPNHQPVDDFFMVKIGEKSSKPVLGPTSHHFWTAGFTMSWMSWRFPSASTVSPSFKKNHH